MARVAKFTRSELGHIFAHFERAKDINSEYLKFGNQEININLSHFTVSAKITLNKAHLRHFHSEVSNYMANVFGRNVGLLNGVVAR
jgi:hypothetical protein